MTDKKASVPSEPKVRAKRVRPRKDDWLEGMLADTYKEVVDEEIPQELLDVIESLRPHDK